MKLTPQIDPQLLATFVAIVDEGSFAAAARRVGRTVSAVSMQMKRLERLFGPAPLFEPDGRTRRLTTGGEILLAHSRHILRLHEEVWTAMARAAATGTIRLGAPDDYAGTLLPRALDRFSIKFPRMQIEVICEPSQTLVRMIDDHDLDLAVVTRQRDGGPCETLRREPLVWVGLPGSELVREDTLPVSLFQAGCLARSLALDALASAGRPCRIMCSSPSVSGIFIAVRAGWALGVAAKCSVPADLAIFGEADGLPGLPHLAIDLIRSSAPGHPPVLPGLVEEIRVQLAA